MFDKSGALTGQLKKWLFWFGLAAAAVFGVMRFANFPSRVAKVELGVEENEDSIDKVAHTFDKYMVEQRTIQSEQNKREDLMLKILDRVR